MKTSQWLVAVIVLAVLVFGLTYAMNYLGWSKPKDEVKGTREVLKLRFPKTKFGSDPDSFMPVELNREAKADYWFINTNEQPLKMGLQEKPTCKCSSVQVFHLPSAAQGLLCAAAASQALLPVSLGLQVYVPPWVSFLDDYVAERIAKETQPVTLTVDNETQVPANGLGLVRLTIKTEQVGPRPIKVKMWADQKRATPTELQVGLFIVSPIMVEETHLGAITLKGRSFWGAATNEMYCYSLTRDTLNLKATVEHDGRAPASDPLQVLGAPEKMTVAEMHAALASKLPKFQEQVRCMYRAPVRLNERAKDGTPFELGHLRRRIHIALVRGENDFEDERDAVLSGEIKGEVMVNTLQDGYIQFDTFQSAIGSKEETVAVQTDVGNLDLEVDNARTAEFLQADLEGPVQSPTSSRRSWTLKVQVRPNSVRSKFPDPEAPAYRDSAVYLKTKGPSPQWVRIPAAGTPN
jgi:hypothetical protein